MKSPNPGLIVSLLLLFAASCAGQTLNPVQGSIKRVGEPPANRKEIDPQTGNPTTSNATPAIETLPMPGVGIDHSTLEQVLQSIHNAAPEFNSVVVRSPGVPTDYPTIPSMSFKNVTVGQFLQFVQVSFPGITCFRIDGGAGPLYSIRISQDRFGGGGGGEGLFPKPNTVHLYRLTEVINSLADENTIRDSKDNKDLPREARIKTATDEVLSLLQAALDQTDSDGPCVLKMHDPTLTLLFKGSAAKQSVLEDALNSLGGGRSARGFAGGRGASFGGGGSGGGGFSGSSPSDMTDAVRVYQSELVQRQAEIATLQQRLAEANKSLTTRPSKE